MKKSSAELKRLARESLTGRYGTPIMAMLLSTLIPSLILLPFLLTYTDESSISQNIILNIASFLVTLIQMILMGGLIYIYLKLSRKQNYQLSDITYGFHNHPEKYVGAYLLLMLYTILPVLPGIILLALCLEVFTKSFLLMGLCVVAFMIGIVFSIRIALEYNLVFFLLVDHPEEKVMHLLKESKSLMQGNKGRCFYLIVSFIGWLLLGIGSLGIGFIWIYPYITQTTIYFYLDVLEEKVNII